MKRKRQSTLRSIIIACLLLAGVKPASSVRIKDIASIRGFSKTPLVGYSLVVGLDGTGDGRRSLFTQQSIQNMLQRFGLTVTDDRMTTRNVAAVMVTAELSPFSREGSTLDVTVSSMGDATSLEGGTLLLTELMGKNGIVHAHAQGNVSVGGISIETMAGEKYRKNYALVGRVPGGAVVETALANPLMESEGLELILRDPDFTTAMYTADAVDGLLGEGTALPLDAATVRINVPEEEREPHRLVRMIALLESADVAVDQVARVVINERTGTVVVGGNVRLSSAAICQGDLTVRITAVPIVSQPNAFASGETVVVPTTMTTVTESDVGQVMVLNEPASVSDLANALNAMKLSARDVISIFQALKQAGALQAELVIM